MVERESLRDILLKIEPALGKHQRGVFYEVPISPEEDKLISHIVERGIFTRLEKHLAGNGRALFDYNLFRQAT